MPPVALDIFVGKTFIFKIKTDDSKNGKYAKSYFVYTMTDAPDMIKLFTSSDDTVKYSLQISSIDANSEPSIQKHQSHDIGDISITSENDLESYSQHNVTPMKRMSHQNLDFSNIEENSPAQASSTKELKRVKIEK
ncbi:uncharacterized protein LOC130710384 [Lotus japonicus]|uniref:uncharacterized protein LOC130710384 n=1 Tax=Lotus japonicus TaxID=34305 RepID=UPI002585B50E|nr:uncharacterized protein LOC130710384 [Lotus japonicus]